MEVQINKNSKKSILLTAENQFDWEFIKGLIQMADPIALTKYMQDKGFVTVGDEVVDILDLIDEKMEAK